MSEIQVKKRKSICIIVLVTIIFRETILAVKIVYFFLKAGCKTCKLKELGVQRI